MNWEQLERKRQKFVNRYIKAFNSVFRRQMRSIISKLDELRDFDLFLGQVYFEIKEDDLYPVFKRLYRDAGLEFKKIVDAEFKNLENDLWLEEMEKFVVLHLGENITSITGTTRLIILGLIKNEIQLGTEMGLSINEIARNIKKNVPNKWGKRALSRAKTIAQTEVIGASNYASLRAAEDLNLPMEKIWITAPIGVSKDERHNIMGMNGQRRRLDQPYDVGGEPMMYPGDQQNGSVGNIANCKCTQVYEVIGG